MIDPIATALNIPTERIFANSVHFNQDGSYSGFDENEPTSRSGGKPDVVARYVFYIQTTTSSFVELS
jgi:phosphoserine phosphatase